MRSDAFDEEGDHSRVYGFVTGRDPEHYHSLVLCPNTPLATEIDLQNPDLDKDFSAVEIHYLKMIYRMQKIYSQRIPGVDQRLEEINNQGFAVNLNAFALAVGTFNRYLKDLVKFTAEMLSDDAKKPSE